LCEFEINFTPEEIDRSGIDIWGAAFLWVDDDRGVEYNLCYDNGICECAIYKTEMNKETDYMSTDYSTFEHYEVNPEDKHWKVNLILAMENAAHKFWY
jgi:hypothetical protein